MALLQRFPPEILDHVWSNLSSADLITVSRVSRHCNVISAPFLYRAPKLDSDSSTRYLLLRTLLTPGREWLATHVKSLHVHWNDREAETKDIPASDIALLTLGASRRGLENPFTSEGVQVILLLSLLPSLRVLSMNLIEDDASLLKNMEDDHVDRPLMTLPIRFRSLRQFHWASSNMQRSPGISFLLEILSLPDIRIMTVQMGAPEVCDALHPTPTITSNSLRSSVTHLTFNNGNIADWWIPGVLQIPLALTHLSLEQFLAAKDRIPDLRIALQPLKSSLQLLHLDYCVVGQRKRSTNTIGSLRDWPVLRTVRITPGALMVKNFSPNLADVLPECIRDLEFLSDREWPTEELVPELLVLLEQKDKVAGLRTLRVLMTIRKSREVIGKLQVACMKAGVVLKEKRFRFGFKQR